MKSDEQLSGLAYHIKNELYDKWKDERQNHLDEKWQRNLDNYKGVSSGKWKKEENKEDWQSDTFIQVTKTKVIQAYSMVIDVMLQGGELPLTFVQSPDVEMSYDNLSEDQQKTVDDTLQDMTNIVQNQFQDFKADIETMKMVLACAMYGEAYAKRYVRETTKTGYREVSFTQEPQSPPPQGIGQGQPQQLPQQSPQPLQQQQGPALTPEQPQQAPQQPPQGLSQQQPQLGQPQPGQQQRPPQQPQQPQKRYEAYSEKKMQPAFEYVPVWDVYRDLETDDLQASTGIIFKKLICPYDLKMKTDQPFYIKEAIETAISEAPEPGTTTESDSTDDITPAQRNIAHRFRTIENLEFWGRVPRKTADEFEADLKKKTKLSEDDFSSILGDVEYDGDEVECLVEMAGDQVIRYVRTEPNERPVYRIPWELTIDMIKNYGVADNVETENTVLNGMVRTFEDNKKLSANVMFGLNTMYIPDFDGKLVPGKAVEMEGVDDIRKAIQPFVVPDVGESLLSGISLIERYSDEASMIPKLMQGTVAVKQKPDTLGEMQMLQQNAGKYIGAVIKNFDNFLFEPVGLDFYRYNMDDPEVSKGKGNFIPKALGFTSYQNRIERMQKLMQAIQIALMAPPITEEIKFRPMVEDLFKSLDMDPNTVLKTPEEKAAARQAQMQMIQMQQKLKQMELQLLTQAEIQKTNAKVSAESQRDLAKIGAETQRDQAKITAETQSDIITLNAETQSKSQLSAQDHQEDIEMESTQTQKEIVIDKSRRIGNVQDMVAEKTIERASGRGLAQIRDPRRF
jgi:hypothetical protein